ncbi:MAG: hypothetical protein K2P25_12095 [Lachnospiraceae bacterium]|nr:hypothetical protein [Lachnospiraceae bacterium]
MKFPFFASFIVFCLWLLYEIKKSRNAQEKSNEMFWQREAEANSTRRKSLDSLAYIRIPFEALPMELLKDDPSVSEYHETLRELSKSPIVNFTGISNTDLKLMYGAPNITLLSRYDQSYTFLVRTLQNWGQTLYERGYTDEACQVLEFAVETRTDITATYKLLASIYREKNQPEKTVSLIPIAESLNTSLSGHIVAMLKKAGQEPET